MRIDDAKPNAAEQASRDDRNRQNVKQKDPALNSQAAQQASSKQTKDFKSLFDQALEKAKVADQPTQSEAAKFDAKIKDALSDSDKGKDRDRSDRKKEKDEDKKVQSNEEKEGGKNLKEGGIKDKVLGKQDMGGRGSGGGSFSDGKGDSSGQFGQRQQGRPQLVKVDVAAPNSFQMQQVNAVNAVKDLQNIKHLQKIPPQVLDQIVQHIRIGMNKNLDKEIQLDLSEKIFKGLSLRVSSHQGKLQVFFITRNPDVKRLFESQKQQIHLALEQKGFGVGKIQVGSE